MLPRIPLLFAALVLCLSCHRRPDPLPGFPRLVLWAWERPENLAYIVPASTGVAYLADTITLTDSGPERRPRFQPLWIPDGTPLMAVVRIESRASRFPPTEEAARLILHAAQGKPFRALQIDFDARASERRYYCDLMRQIRRSLPPSIALEMTALVSWCQSDDWIKPMPVVDAVPMFFRMGVDPHSAHEHLREPLCASSIGIATDEFYVPIPSGKRVFIFNNRPWTETSYRAVLQASKGWS